MKTRNEWIELVKDIPAFNKVVAETGERPDLINANLICADLSDANLRNANLSNANLFYADLRNADLSDANLSDANLWNAKHLKSPKVENLFTKIKAAIDAGGGFAMEDWHNKCRTTHCLAGWAVTLAGDRAIEQEDYAGTAYIGALIIKESCPYLKGIVPNFYATNEEGMKFIEKCVELEKEQEMEVGK